MKPEPCHPPETEFEIVAPRAASLVESLRAFGYDLGTAIADLVDNSISAGTKNVWIDFNWAGIDSSITVTDDGHGMSESMLRNAMRLGSRHPSEKRDTDDLGRFGLGLKTASFSQCRCVTVCTKESNQQTILRRWDLDHLAKADAWQVLLEARIGTGKQFDRLSKLASGTCILWQQMDRIMRGLEGNSERHRDAFIARCEEVERHIALVFHRLLEKNTGIRLFINEHPVKPFDPFFIGEATQIMQEQSFPCAGGFVKVEPFVMPHESKLLDADERKLAGEPKDWTARQGFYIYRQDRLLVAASWLGYREWRKDEHHKLARIRISLPNTSDEEWQIDVTKSKARPPEALRSQIRAIGETTRSRAKRVYTFRGERLFSTGAHGVRFVWEQIVRHGRTSYLINREHPAISALLADSSKKSGVEAMLQIIEGSIPIPLIAYNSREEPETPSGTSGETDSAVVRIMAHQAWHALKGKGLGDTEVLSVLAQWEPFNLHPALLQEIREEPPRKP